MLHLLSEAGRSFLRAFGGAMLILLPGVLMAPNLDQAKGIGVAALIASLAAGIKAIQVFVPKLSFSAFIRRPYGALVDSFVRAFVGTLLTLGLGILNAPELHFSKAALVALLVAAVTAGLRALQGLLTPGSQPSPQTGIATPPPVRKA